MKSKAIILSLLAAATMMLGGCKEKKQTTEEESIITTRYVPKRPQGPIALPADSQVVTTKWLGGDYTILIRRTPVDSICVTDDSGQKYIDNRAHLTIRRADGSVFTEKIFSKNAFASYIKEPFLNGGILASIRFEDVENTRLKFTAVVAMPEAVDDLFIPLKMTIDGQGGLAISHEDDMGMLDYDRNFESSTDDDEGV